MKKLLFLFLILTSFVRSQTLVAYDYMETWNWPGYWIGFSSTSIWATNAFVSSNESAVIYGLGSSGDSSPELDYYVLPNITGLNPNKQYQFRFKLASYSFTGPGASTRGVDGSSSNLDRVDVQVSTDGELTYTTELRIRGNSNSQFPYSSTGTIYHTANGLFTNSTAPTGDVYQTPAGINTTGPSTVILDLPLGITQVAIDMFCRVNSLGEEWWIDNIELWDMEVTPLPVELMSFNGKNNNNSNILTWTTATEFNSDYFLIERSSTGNDNDFKTIGSVNAAGNSTQIINYKLEDNSYEKEINYYRLLQYDKDGVFKTYPVIAIDNRRLDENIIKIVNLLGQEVDENYKGIVILIYGDGTSKKVIR